MHTSVCLALLQQNGRREQDNPHTAAIYILSQNRFNVRTNTWDYPPMSTCDQRHYTPTLTHKCTYISQAYTHKARKCGAHTQWNLIQCKWVKLHQIFLQENWGNLRSSCKSDTERQKKKKKNKHFLSWLNHGSTCMHAHTRACICVWICV